ncbi:MAG: mechanosensitive ion channel family protein [Flavobacteriales bacterium]|nr:mechanosensitive ion channel family protein [Flavobacteriales bacterium]
MTPLEIRIIETLVVIVLYFVIGAILKNSVEKVGVRFKYHKPRIKILNKIINLILFILFAGLLISIWGVEQSKLIFVVTSLLTVLGIAFFAKWSIISNITSAIIIYFNHIANIGDHIEVIDKDFSIKGKISDIGMFFIVLKSEEGEKVSIPSNVFMQKMIKRFDH